VWRIKFIEHKGKKAMKKPYVNTSNKIQHIGNVTVMPGQTREIEAAHIAAHTGVGEAQPDVTTAVDPLVILLSENVKTIKNSLSELSADALDNVEKMESAADKPRSGVMKAIAEERLNRAVADSASDVEKFINSLDGMSDEELTEYAELYKDDNENVAYLDAVNTEIEKRAA
jgi:hypothetical protein